MRSSAAECQQRGMARAHDRNPDLRAAEIGDLAIERGAYLRGLPRFAKGNPACIDRIAQQSGSQGFHLLLAARHSGWEVPGQGPSSSRLTAHRRLDFVSKTVEVVV
jgi:hypothetical protein